MNTTLPIIPVEVKISCFKQSENETQHKLRGILDWWGPDGRRWAKGSGGANGACAAGACLQIYGHWEDLDKYLEMAAVEMGFSQKGPHRAFFQCSDSGFENARQMVLRAITLAATPEHVS